MKTNYSCLLTCEHASSAVPTEFEELFLEHAQLLKTHRGSDIGADLIWALFKNNYIPHSELFVTMKGKYTRLLIDLNRTLNHPHLFSPITKNLPKHLKESIIQQYYQPYWAEAMGWVEKVLQANELPIIHISVHSYTPLLYDNVRNNDIGFLYDPRRIAEKKFCALWAKNIRLRNKNYRVRMNYPYKGTSDALTTFLRKHCPEERYLGIELEVNQKHFTNATLTESFIPDELMNTIVESCPTIL